MAIEETIEPGADYTAPEKGWTDQLQRARARNAAQALVIGVQAIALVALAALVVWLTAFRAPAAYVLRVDPGGDVTYGGPLLAGALEGDEVIPAQLMRFVERWRGVTPDNPMQKRRVRRLYCMLRSTTPAHRRLNEYFRDAGNDPFERNRTLSVMTETRSVSKLGGNTWQIEWYERARAHDGAPLGERRTLKATLIVERGTPEAACLEGNPLGVYVSDLDWGAVR